MTELKENQLEEEFSFLKDDDYQRFIELHKIQSEDFKIIENLFSYPAEFFITELHNLFGFSKESSAKEIKDRINQIKKALEEEPEDRYLASSKEKIPFLELFFEITEKYGWMTARHLNSLLEGK